MKRLHLTFRKSTIWLFVFIMAATIAISPSKAWAADVYFRSSNTQVFNEAASACSVGVGEGTTVLAGKENLESILRYYVGKGLSLAQASGIAGNFKRESGFNPAIIQGGTIADANYSPVNSVGFGLAQWTFTSRQQPLVNLAKSSNRPITDLSLQLDYSWQELSGPYAKGLANLKASTSPDNAAYVFHRDYEGSADTEAEVRANRGGDAVAIYEQYKSSIPDGSITNTISTQVCTGSGSGGMLSGFTVYDQNDPAWANIEYGNQGTVASAGCGPSAMAMIITNLTKQKVTPKETAEYGRDHSPTTVALDKDGLAAGSLHNIHEVIGSHWGLKSTFVGGDEEAINNALRRGALVIVGGDTVAPFTDLGHILVIRGITADGKWLVGDSNGTIGKENSADTKGWDPKTITTHLTANYAWALEKGTAV